MPAPVGQTTSATFEKGLLVLALFDAEHTHLSLSEIAKLTGIARPTAYRLVATLTQAGYLKRDPASKKVRLGIKSLVLGHNLQRGSDIFPVVKPIIDSAFLEYGVTVDVILFDNPTAVVLYRREAEESVKFGLPTTSQHWHFLAVGKAILAFMPPEERKIILTNAPLVRKTNNTLCTLKEIEADLKLCRRRGYALNNEEYLPGLIAIGVPLFNRDDQRIVGAVSFEFSTVNYTLAEAEKKYAGVVVNLGREISDVLPYM